MPSTSRSIAMLWRAQAGSLGQAEEFLRMGRVALPFPAPDLRKFDPLDAPKARIQADFPQNTMCSVAGRAGRPWPLYPTTKVADSVLYPRKSAATFKLGRSTDRTDSVALLLQPHSDLPQRFRHLTPLPREWIPHAEGAKDESAAADAESKDAVDGLDADVPQIIN